MLQIYCASRSSMAAMYGRDNRPTDALCVRHDLRQLSARRCGLGLSRGNLAERALLADQSNPIHNTHFVI